MVLLSAVLFPENNSGRAIVHLSYIFCCLPDFFVSFFVFFLPEIFLLMNGRDFILLYAWTLSSVESYF